MVQLEKTGEVELEQPDLASIKKNKRYFGTGSARN